MAELQKDTIYIDIDDEITTIIDKLQASSNKVVALVLPKRASALQSIVNMKLLKRAAEQGNKNLVLITTESSLLPLAGAVGLYVAKTPSSRPEIPVDPSTIDDEAIDEIDLDDDVPPLAVTDSSKSVGALAAANGTPLPPKPEADSGVETLELDNTAAPAAAASKAAKTPKHKKDKKLAVPNFNKFRLLLAAGVGVLLLLIVGGYFAFNVLPKATINVKTNASNVNTDVDFTLSTSSTTFTEASKVVPAKRVQSQKTLTGSAPATGQKNNGEKASGSVAVTAGSCSANVPSNLPSGSALSAGGKTYITQSSTSFMPVIVQNRCTYRSTQSTDIRAQTGGQNFNVSSGTDFTVAGRSDLAATGSASGGTDDIQTVVSQADIDNAKGKIAADNSTGAQDELKKQLEDQGMYAITSTFSASTPATTASASVGAEATTVTVTQVVTNTMLGANIANIKSLVDGDIKGQIDTANQAILNQGVTQGSFKLKSATTNGAAMNIQTVAVVGPSLNVDTLAQQAAGKKAGEIKSEIAGNTGVTDVQVKLSPFWVSKAPKNISKITITIAKPTTTANAN